MAPDADIARIWLPLEDELRALMAEATGPDLSCQCGTPFRRRSYTPLPAAMAPRVHRLVQQAAVTLGMTEHVQVYFGDRFGFANGEAIAAVHGPAVALDGGVIDWLDDGQLAALAGHEVGHLLRPERLPAMCGCTLLRSERDRGLREAYAASIELGCDRCAVIAGGGIDALAGLEAALETGARTASLELDTGKLLEEFESQATDEDHQAFPSTHPSSAYRVHAAHLFWRSDLHHELTGRGPADVPITDVDRMLRERLEREKLEPWRENVRKVEAMQARAKAFRREHMRQTAPRPPPGDTLGEEIADVITGTAARVVDFVHQVRDRVADEFDARQHEPAADPGEDDRLRAELDDLEKESASPVDDFEKRFQALEEAARQEGEE